MLNDKLKELAAVGEPTATEKEGTPEEYRLYVRERDKNNE